MKTFLTLTLFLSFVSLSILVGQDLKTMDESVYTEWKSINNTNISTDGDWVTYSLKTDNGDNTTVIYNTRNKKEIKLRRTEKAEIDYSNSYLYILRKPSVAFVREQKRNNVKKEDMPGDTLVIYNLDNQTETIYPSISKFKIPEKSGQAIAAEIHNNSKDKTKQQATSEVIYINPERNQADTLEHVIDFVFAKESPSLLFSVKSDSLTSGGVFIHNGTSIDTSFIIKAKIYSLAINNDASQAAFVVDTDTTDMLHRPYKLYYWSHKNELVSEILNSESSFLPNNWTISHETKPAFSEDGSRLLFGVTPQRLMQDTSKLDEEIVNVEVWHYQQPKLYTQQELDADDDEKKSYDVVYFTETNKLIQLQNEEIPDLRMDKKRQSQYALAYTDLPYKTHETWQGYAERDVYKVNIGSGQKTLVASAIHGRPQLSPEGKYIYWYSTIDSTWLAHNTLNNQTAIIGDSNLTAFSNELHDAPSYPRPYGLAGWTVDQELIAYDRYDLWLLDPNNPAKTRRLTNGRENKIQYRHIELDEDQEMIDLGENILLHLFDEKDKSSGYAYLDNKSGAVTTAIKNNVHYTTSVHKAKNTNDIIYSKQSFQLFPNLIHDKLDFKNPKQISDANPQQSDYAWGDNKIVSWTAFDGQALEGILVTPPGFDPNKQYPLLVNFYERSSDRLHRHRAPSAGRSTINYSFYANRGYLIFNPDVPYTIGEPGESCYNAVISGIEALIAEGFVDQDRIGVQGHSWGGYQVAHLVTKTDIFACAESGAPLVNMTSAYGGIRWGTGRSRQFQYEKTQSRLGATLWESPETYIRNSPLFNADKINTPVLIMHNDSDGHVPWHLGIEFFMALRRLQQPTWLLNYNGEPHWPLKWQNRLDFNIRMQQYFDHYLMDAPMPNWMKDGIPAIEKGIRSGYETNNKN